MVGQLVANHFVAAHQQVGDFRVTKVGNRINKNGGNVATHFLTPTGHVIHSVTGPVTASVLLHEAQWAIDTYEAAKGKPYLSRLNHVASAHNLASLSPTNSQDRQVHQLFMSQPLPNLQDVYVDVFQRILGQPVSKAGPRLAQAKVILERAKKTGRPLLFILHDGSTWNSSVSLSPAHRPLMDEYLVITMPLREAPALSQLTGQPPYESNSQARPLFVVASSDCTQLRSVGGWDEAEVTRAMAFGWADALQRDPPDVRSLVRAQRILRKADPASADKIRQLTIQVQEEAKTQRDAETSQPATRIQKAELASL